MKYLKLFENFTKSDNFFDDPNYFGCGCCKNCNGEVDCECCDNCGTTIYDDNQNDEEWAGGTFKSDNDKYKEYLRDLESGRINSIDDIEDEEEYDPYSYEGCGCCPVCTGEKDCECGCPECNYPEELEELEESKKSGVTASLKKKSKASGIPMGILRKVFAKGMQAWNAGHRPGVAQHQWGMGRVNSFITGAGGARKADAALWAKAKAAKARKKKRK